MERLPKITELPKPKREELYSPENYDDVALELKENMVISFMKSTALSPQNFVLQQAAALEHIAVAREKGLQPELLFVQLTDEEKESIGQRLEYARDKLHVAHGVARRNNPSSSKDIFNKVFSAHTVGSALALEKRITGLGISNTELQLLSMEVQKIFHEHKQQFAQFRANASGNESQVKEAELWLQDFIREVQDELQISDVGKEIAQRTTSSVLYRAISELLPEDIILG